ncbi:unnamed protein product, partial [Coccothraustes coccothraustes]
SLVAHSLSSQSLSLFSFNSRRNQHLQGVQQPRKGLKVPGSACPELPQLLWLLFSPQPPPPTSPSRGPVLSNSKVAQAQTPALSLSPGGGGGGGGGALPLGVPPPFHHDVSSSLSQSGSPQLPTGSIAVIPPSPRQWKQVRPPHVPMVSGGESPAPPIPFPQLKLRTNADPLHPSPKRGGGRDPQ